MATQLARGALFLVVFTFEVFVVNLCFFPANILLLVPNRKLIVLRRRYISFISGLFSEFTTELFERVCGSTVYLYTDDPEIFKEKTGPLVICNHRTRIDWLYCFWCYGAYIKIGEYFRVILKESLKSVPLFGWAGQMSLYIFLRRSRDADLPHIFKVVSYLLRTSEKVAVLLFPEGTDLSESNIAKANTYAREKNLQEFKYVLHPKPSGFFACVQAMKQNSNGCVHDLTMAYKDFTAGERPDEMSVFTGRYPPEVHIAIERIPFDAVPDDRSGQEQWLRERFCKKEKMLQSFYEIAPASSVKPKGLWPKQIKKYRTSNYFAIVFYGVIQLVILYGLIMSSSFRWVCLCVIVGYITVSIFKGFDEIEMMMHGDAMLSDAPIFQIDSTHPKRNK